MAGGHGGISEIVDLPEARGDGDDLTDHERAGSVPAIRGQGHAPERV